MFMSLSKQKHKRKEKKNRKQSIIKLKFFVRQGAMYKSECNSKYVVIRVREEKKSPYIR